MPIDNGTGFISYADYMNGNQDTLAGENQAIGDKATADLNTAETTSKADSDAAAAHTTDIYNEKNPDNGKQFASWANHHQGEEGNPFTTVGKVDPNTRNILGSSPGDPYGGQKAENSIQDVYQAGTNAANLGNWGGVFDAVKQRSPGIGAGAGFEATLLGGGAGLQDVAKAGAGAGDAASNYYDNAIANGTHASGYETYKGGTVGSDPRTTGQGAYGEGDGSGLAGENQAPAGAGKGMKHGPGGHAGQGEQAPVSAPAPKPAVDRAPHPASQGDLSARDPNSFNWNF